MRDTATRRNAFYVLLLAFVAFGGIVDYYVWGSAGLVALNDFTQMVGIIALCILWLRADASVRDRPATRLSVIATILFPPAGTTIHLFQSRSKLFAFGAALLFWTGVFMAFFAGDIAGSWIVDVPTTVALGE
ncbi:hypothetical protein OCGS_0625 [Oceaniovalibus guishaninsula JLT2003]|uniref:Uncharacterized protein n=1 Tax=Oceaniovalibus guishaninsula JLT2003 TaxID=1231392 RepID=K2I972_9RHOB|nr:hypothetical protein [Oceaniovalibus guishaninsula]EKE45535.1 hypothetical protein OCGS_0625 [Oceaniovalibus guishaninsula JLT2003]